MPRIPTAALRLASVFSERAKESLSIRKAIQRLGVNDVRNCQNPRKWAQPPTIDTDIRVKIPRASLHQAAAPPRSFTSASISTRLESIVTTRATSWLHHGFGAPASTREAPSAPTPPPAKSELHPWGLLQRESSADASKTVSTLDRQAYALIQGEKDLSTFFGDVQSDDAISLNSARLGYVEVDALSIASTSDSDWGDEWDDVTSAELAEADQRFERETRDIEAFERDFASSQSAVQKGPSDTADLGTSMRGQSSDQNAATVLMEAVREAKGRTQAFDSSDSSDESDAIETDGLPALKLRANLYQQHIEKRTAAFNEAFDRTFGAPRGEPKAAEASGTKVTRTLMEQIREANGKPQPRTAEIKTRSEVIEQVSYQDTMSRALFKMQSTHGDSLSGSDDDSGLGTVDLPDVTEDEWNA